MTQINITIKNLPQIRAALAKSPQVVSKHINKAINKSILDIRNEAMSTTPVDTGRLRGSYQMKFGALKGELSPTANYAIYVHEGHRQEVGRYVAAIGKRLVSPYVKGNPFLKKAVNQANDKVQKNFEEGLKGALGEIAQGV